MQNKEWFYANNDKAEGPVPVSVIEDLIKTGQMTKDTLVWNSEFDKDKGWVKASETELETVFNTILVPSTSPPVPNTPLSVPTSAVVSSSNENTQESSSANRSATVADKVNGEISTNAIIIVTIILAVAMGYVCGAEKGPIGAIGGVVFSIVSGFIVKTLRIDNKTGRPLLTKATFKAFGILIALLLVGIFFFGDTPNKYIVMVKGGYPLEYPNQTYDAAFSNFFRNPKWSYFKSEDGDNVVAFTGDCVYMDAEVKATLQFIVNEDDGTFEAHYLGFNEVPQNNLILWALIEKVFGGE